jgi:hypothetical protein
MADLERLKAKDENGKVLHNRFFAQPCRIAGCDGILSPELIDRDSMQLYDPRYAVRYRCPDRHWWVEDLSEAATPDLDGYYHLRLERGPAPEFGIDERVRFQGRLFRVGQMYLLPDLTFCYSIWGADLEFPVVRGSELRATSAAAESGSPSRRDRPAPPPTQS